MKIIIQDTGDREHNIPPVNAVIDINLCPDDYGEESRNYFRATLGEFFKGLFDLHGKMSVTFDDECPVCLKKLKDGKCQTLGCKGV